MGSCKQEYTLKVTLGNMKAPVILRKESLNRMGSREKEDRELSLEIASRQLFVDILL